MLSYMCKYGSRNCRTHGKNNRKAYISLQSEIREIRKKSKAWFPSSVNSSSFKLFFWNYFSSSGLILFGINSITFPLIIKSNVDLFQLILRWVKASQKKKRCYFFCQEGVVESKKVRKSVKSQDFGLEAFFAKGSNMENIATTAETENLRSRILF